MGIEIVFNRKKSFDMTPLLTVTCENSLKMCEQTHMAGSAQSIIGRQHAIVCPGSALDIIHFSVKKIDKSVTAHDSLSRPCIFMLSPHL